MAFPRRAEGLLLVFCVACRAHTAVGMLASRALNTGKIPSAIVIVFIKRTTKPFLIHNMNSIVRVLLLNPPFKKDFSRSQRSPGVTKAGTLYYPYWLVFAAGMLEKAGVEVSILDAPAAGLNEHDVLKRVAQYRPDIVVSDTSTPSIHADCLFIKRVKENFPNINIVLVGTHPSAVPEEVFTHYPYIDCICRREYDLTLIQAAEAVAHHSSFDHITGISFMRNNRVIHNPDRPYINNMDDVPMLTPLYKKYLNIRHYRFVAARYPMVMLITGRGCPYQCTFCLYRQTMHGTTYRLCSAERVVEEFKYVTTDMPEVREIVIEDDTFTAQSERVKKICAMLLEKNIRIPWSANSRISVDYETMKLMKKAGCRLLIVGFESGSQEVLDCVKKGIRLEQSEQFMHNARRAGILVHGCFMLGLPGDTRQTMQQTFEFAKKLSPDSAQFFPLYVYPGTEAYQWMREHGYLQTEDYRQWVDAEGQHQCVINVPGMSCKDIDRLSLLYYKKYHFAPAYILKKSMQLFTAPREGMRSLYAAMRFIIYMLQRKNTP